MRAKSLLAASLGLALGLAATQAGAFSMKAFNGPVIFKLGGYTTENDTQIGTDETTWGAGNVTQILNALNQTEVLWQQKDAAFGNETIGYMLYGIADANITTGGFPNPFNIFNVGCTGAPCDSNIHIDLYLNPTGFNFGSMPTSTRSGFNTLPGITDGTLLMQWKMIPGMVASDIPGGSNPMFDERNTTLYQNVTDANLSPSINGLGSFYAKCVGGDACGGFATDVFTTGLGTKADLRGSFSLVPASGTASGWEGDVSDPVRARAISEPASLALLGAGLLGLITWRRRGYSVA